MLDTLAEAHAQRWSNNDELLASILEVLHALYVVTLKVHSKKSFQAPKPLRVPRPQQPKSKPAVIRPADLVRRLFGR